MPSSVQSPVLMLSQHVQLDETDVSSMWAVFTKCKENLENGRRLENMSWRLWYRACQSQKASVERKGSSASLSRILSATQPDAWTQHQRRVSPSSSAGTDSTLATLSPEQVHSHTVPAPSSSAPSSTTPLALSPPCTAPINLEHNPTSDLVPLADPHTAPALLPPSIIPPACTITEPLSRKVQFYISESLENGDAPQEAQPTQAAPWTTRSAFTGSQDDESDYDSLDDEESDISDSDFEDDTLAPNLFTKVELDRPEAASAPLRPISSRSSLLSAAIQRHPETVHSTSPPTSTLTEELPQALRQTLLTERAMPFNTRMDKSIPSYSPEMERGLW